MLDEKIISQAIVERFYKKLLFATDYLYAGQSLPIIDYLNEVKIPKRMKEFIFKKNALKILNI